MSQYKVIGIDLAKQKFHVAAIDASHHVVLTRALSRKDFFEQVSRLFPGQQTFAFEACGGAHYTAQELQALGHTVILLKTKDVQAYAQSRQKNDRNDAIAICKAACDPELKHVHPKTKAEKEVAYLHKARSNTIQQRIQRSNSLMTSLFEFGYLVSGGKTRFATECKEHVKKAYREGFIVRIVYEQMLLDCTEIAQLLAREKALSKAIAAQNKASPIATLLQTIPGIGPINASALSVKPMHLYDSPEDFSASIGLVPRQHTTGGEIRLGSITKQGDRYLRRQLIQGGRTIVMRYYKGDWPQDALYQFIDRLVTKRKRFNVICVAVANKLARIAYTCATQHVAYKANP